MNRKGIYMRNDGKSGLGPPFVSDTTVKRAIDNLRKFMETNYNSTSYIKNEEESLELKKDLEEINQFNPLSFEEFGLRKFSKDSTGIIHKS